MEENKNVKNDENFDYISKTTRKRFRSVQFQTPIKVLEKLIDNN